MKKFISLLLVAALSTTETAQAIRMKAPYQDGFMEKVIANYSTVEGGIPKLTKAKAKEVAFQILITDGGMKDGAANGLISDRFEKYWAHFDVNAAEKIDSDMIVPFMH